MIRLVSVQVKLYLNFQLKLNSTKNTYKNKYLDYEIFPIHQMGNWTLTSFYTGKFAHDLVPSNIMLQDATEALKEDRG